jgi:type II secretory pathway component PulF
VLFEKTGKELPLLTRMLIGISSFISNYWWAIIAGLVLIVLAFNQAVRTGSGKIWWHRAQLRVPLVGDILRRRFYTQFAQTTANLLENGIPLLSGLRLMNNATANLYIRQSMSKVVDMVGEGGSLSRALQRVGEFPPLMIDMVSVGEQTGDLAKALDRVGRRYDKELNLRIQRLTALIQPVVILIMAGMVGTLAYSIINGIFDAVSGLNAR